MPLPKFSSIPQKPLVHGDSLSLSIAAASIIAKVTRDRGIRELHEKYPQYGFGGHKGYGTEEHLLALKTHGPCPEHRMTFGPVLSVSAQKSQGGVFQFWSAKLKRARNSKELHQLGLQIKRSALPDLSQRELELLRELFKSVRAPWEKKKS
jgi:ribonuclease HII